ncbi:MAG: helical backbone metal receptor [Ginsengibacter sp.]
MILFSTTSQRKYSRIISLVPSQTELLFHLGLEHEVVGLTKFCIHPSSWFRSKARIGGTKNININKIHALSPDLIIANKEENVREQIEELAMNYDVWLTDVNDLTGAISMINDIGKLTGKETKTTALASEINAGFQILREISSSRDKISAAYIIWKDPYMVAAHDTFINDMMHYCGMHNVFSDRSRYPQITLADIRNENATLILLSSEPFPFKEKHKKEIKEQLPGIKIELVDGEMFSWYGSRLLKSIDYFYSCLLKR